LLLNIADWVLFHARETDFAANHIPYVIYSVVDHSGTLKRQTPRDHTHVLLETHGLQHLWSKNSGISDFYPTIKHRMESKNFQRRLSVGVKRRLVFKICHANFAEEGIHDSQQVSQSNVLVDNDSLDLVEFG